jgi:hypothetical protein
MNSTGILEDTRVGIRLRLAILWIVILVFYLYNDIFMLMRDLRAGDGAGDSPPSEVTMLVYAMVITPCALMPWLCLALKPAVNRWVNIAVGAAYFAIIVWTLTPSGTHLFYRFIGVVENLITLLVIWTAWRWPTAQAPGAEVAPDTREERSGVVKPAAPKAAKAARPDAKRSA